MRHLILLVGTNPLPNAVAARLLANPGDKITLFGSKDSGREIAQRLGRWLSRQYPEGESPTIAYATLSNAGDEYRPTAITSRLEEHFAREWPNSRPDEIHLHYTGGTKTMSVHARAAALAWRNRQSPRPRFRASYLDPEALALVTDPDENEDEELKIPQKVETITCDRIQVTMSDFLDLHGWNPDLPDERGPVLPDLALALAKAHADDAGDGLKAWEDWKCQELLPRTKEWREDDELPGRCTETGEWLKIWRPIGRWRRQNSFWRTIVIPPPSSRLVPHLWQPDVPLIDAISGIAPDDLALKPEHFCKWLDGNWLESAVMQALCDLKEAKQLYELRTNVKPRHLSGNQDLGFEFDVIAIRGYRLFAFSCTTGNQSKGQLKHKLFEASVRARQMGGDEARTALVCCTSRDCAGELQEELERELDLKDKIAVFGRTDLGDLTSAIGAWLDEN